MNKTEFAGEPEYVELADLTLSGAQRDILVILAGGGDKQGTEITDMLNDIRDINKSRSYIYSALDGLDDKGLIEVGSRDGRTNSYALSSDGEMALIGYFTWIQGCIRSFDGLHVELKEDSNERLEE